MSDSYSDGFLQGILLGISITMFIVVLCFHVKNKEQNKEWEHWAETQCEKIENTKPTKYKCNDGITYIIKE